MTQVSIRPVATERELEAAIRLLQEFFREGQFETSSETVAANARHMYELRDHCLMLVVWTDDVPIAVATVSMDFGSEFGWQAERGDLYVVPSVRGQRLASRLVEECAAWACARGAGSLAVTVTSQGGQDLDRFYRALDFQGDGRRVLLRWLIPRCCR
jgi:GNAT superfamily N-acetyltransferase